jgi:mannonate dehydratase
MDRRSFLAGAVAQAAVPGLPKPSPDAARPSPAVTRRPPVKFTLGCQSGPTDERRLQFFARHGVTHICGYPPGRDEMREPYTVEELTTLRELGARHGVSVDMIALPFLASSHVDRTKRAGIVLGESPDRERDVEHVQATIRNCARAGIPAIKYNMSLLGVLRTPRTTGRGGSTLSTWRLAEAGEQASRVTRAGRVPADLYWERITWFLERVIPVANEHRIRMCCHPHDPGVPPGFQGIDAVLGTVDGIKRFVSIQESPYHGLNFCQGTVSEMLKDPGREIFDVIRHFGTRGKIFNVHFRNIRGRRDSFQETYPDEGDVDFVEAIRTYRDVGYQYMLMPDHVPQHADDPDGLQAFAFAYGYTRALIQAAGRLGD